MRAKIGSKAVVAAACMVALACGGGGGGGGGGSGGSGGETAPEAPTFVPGAGTYSSAQTVTISSATAGASIHYTTDGSTPTSSSTSYAGPVSVSATSTLKAIAVAGGKASSVSTAAYVIDASLPVAAAPTFLPAAGIYTAPQSVALSSTSPGASIFYTTNGDPPTTSSTPYTAPVSVPSSLTIKAIATATGYSISPVATAAYVINLPPVAAAPSFDPPAGDYRGVDVKLSTTSSGAIIHYTTNGDPPTTSSTQYDNPIHIEDGHADVTIRAIAAGDGFRTSPEASATYTSHRLATFALVAPGCYPSGSALGRYDEPVYVVRDSVATYLDGTGALQTCQTGELRIGCDALDPMACGLLVEPARTQLYPAPGAPADGSVDLTSTGTYQFWVAGTGSQEISAGTAVATGLPCTATASSPCAFDVTSPGTVSLAAVTGTLDRAQLEAGTYPTSFIEIAGDTRDADLVWIGNPLAGTVNHVVRSQDLTDPAWFALPPPIPDPVNGITVTGGQTDSVGETTAVRATVAFGVNHFFAQPGIAVAPETQYTWSFEARNNGGLAASYSVLCSTSFTDIVPATSYFGRIDDSTWTRIEVPFTTPAGCTDVRVYLLRDSLDRVDILLARPQLELGPAFTSYSPTRASPIAADVSGGSWCIQGSWTPESGASWSGSVQTRLFTTYQGYTQNAFWLSGPGLTWAVSGVDDAVEGLGWSPAWAGGSTHVLAAAHSIGGAITLRADGSAEGTATGGGDGVMDAQYGDLGLTPLVPDGTEPFGGFLHDLVIYRNADCE